MGLRRARQLVVLMAKEFQPYGATWSELRDKSGLKPTAYKVAFNYTRDRKWLIGGGGEGKPYYLNPDGCWNAALGPAYAGVNNSVSPAGSGLQTEIWSCRPSSDPIQTLDPNSKIDRIVALASEAIRYVDQKKF